MQQAIKSPNFKIKDCSTICYEQVKSYNFCKNKIRVVGNKSKKDIKFWFENNDEETKYGKVYVQFIDTSIEIKTNMEYSLVSEIISMDFPNGEGQKFFSCYTPFEVGKYRVLLVVEIDSFLFKYPIESVKGTQRGNVLKNCINVFSHRKVIKNKYSLHLVNNQKTAIEDKDVENKKKANHPEPITTVPFIPKAKKEIDQKKEEEIDWKKEAEKWHSAYQSILYLFSNSLQERRKLPPIENLMNEERISFSKK